MIEFQYLEAAKHYYMEPAGENAVGLVCDFFDVNDTRPAKEQLDDRYSHGGGFDPLRGFIMLIDGSIMYPDYSEDNEDGDDELDKDEDEVEGEILPVLATATLHGERINIYPGGYLAIIQSNGDFAVTRCD
jgi:hypothetical protein